MIYIGIIKYYVKLFSDENAQPMGEVNEDSVGYHYSHMIRMMSFVNECDKVNKR